MVASRTASHRKRLKSHADSTKLVKPSSRIARLSQSPYPPPFKGAHQGLRAFHRRVAFPARRLRPGI